MTRCRRCYKDFPTDQECRLGYEIVCPACFFEDMDNEAFLEQYRELRRLNETEEQGT